MKSRSVILAILLACTAAVPANAVTLSFVFSGLFDGSFDGQAFTDADSTFTGTVDFDADQPVFDGTRIPLTSLTAVGGGRSFTIFTPSVFGLDPVSGEFGIGSFDAPYFLFQGVAGDPFAGPVSVTYAGGGEAFASSAGRIVIDDVTDAMFSIQASGAVPEPASWGMMALGFGMIGAGLRGRLARA